MPRMSGGTATSVTAGGGSSSNITQILGLTTAGQQTMANSLPVTIASNQISFPVTIAAGSAVIGHVITDSGSVTNATLSSETTKVIGTINIAAAQTLATVTTVTTVSNISQIASVTPTFGDVNNAATETGALNVAPVGRYNATQPTLTDTRYNQAQLSIRGELLVAPGVSNFAVQATPVAQVDTFMLGGVNIKEINAVTPLMGNGGTGTGSLRVTIASDNTAFAVNPVSATVPVSTMNSASANSGVNSAMAAVFDDTSPTAITENNFGFLRMSTNRNLYGTIRDAAGNERGANVDANNNLGVVLAAETTKVLGVTRTADGAGNLLTSNSTATSSKFGLDSNILSILGTAPTTAGKLDVKGADGDVFVRQTTGSNLVTNATLQTQTDTVMVGGVNIKEINAVAPLMGNGGTGTGSQRVTIASDNTAVANWGQGATGGAVPTGAQYNGGVAKTALPAAASDGNLTGIMLDKFGRQVVLPQAPRDLISSQTTTITANTETTIVTAGAAGVFNDILSVNIVNTSATPVRIDVRDATSGSVITQFYAPAGDMRGIAYPVPLPQTSAANNWTATVSSAVTDIRIHVQFVKNK